MDFANILLLRQHIKSHPVDGQLSPTFQPSPVCQPRLLKCDECNVSFDAVNELQTHNKTFHARTKPRKSTPVRIQGRGAGSMPKVQQPPPVGRAMAVKSTKQNTTPPVHTFSASVKNVSVPVPLQTLPIEHSNGSEPQAAITDKEVKKPNSNSKEIECPDLDVMYASDVVFVCHVCKECFSKPQFVRDHQVMVHLEYKFACSDRHCSRVF